MWFKNLRVYRLTKTFDFTAETLGAALAEHAFQPCGKQDLKQYGWVPPLGRNGTEYTHAANGYIMVCAKKQEKILPASVVNEHMEEKIAEISNEEGRSVPKAERQNLKDEIIFSLLPRALTKSQLNFAYIAPHENWIVINASSAAKAEELLSALRDAIGSLPVIPLTAKSLPAQEMTQWLSTGETPEGFELGEECELEAPKDEGRVIRCKNQDLSAEEFVSHINTGMVVRKLAISWQESIECVLDHELSVKRLKFSEEILDKVNDKSPDSAAEEFDLDFSIMTMELSGFLKALPLAFGGLQTSGIGDDD